MLDDLHVASFSRLIARRSSITNPYDDDGHTLIAFNTAQNNATGNYVNLSLGFDADCRRAAHKILLESEEFALRLDGGGYATDVRPYAATADHRSEPGRGVVVERHELAAYPQP
ncbi:MAG TPA: hypothetical protein VJ851_02005 [Jatrophihabitans sp.]|nr:hypothetical protein [Jatrophihabitans sp.]